MKRITVILVFLLTFLTARGAEQISTDYHALYGIPEAHRIRDLERSSFPGFRLIGAVAANLGDYPYFAGLLIKLTSGSTSVCGSSLLSHTRLVTAAHCWRTEQHQAQLFTVVLASTRLYSGGTRIPTSSVEVHASYVPSSLSYDIALITISRVEFSSYIQPIALASGDQDYVGTWAKAAGFGKTSDSQQYITRSSYLGQVTLQVISNAVCLQTYAPRFVLPTTLCTSGADGPSTCAGDSGGPLVLAAKGNDTLVWAIQFQIGITSFGSVRGCELGLPSGFSRISAFRSWIQNRL
ncbi:collagenase-like [Zerene cesonia]|uniref:collagenase-like n=1 Tax=Zerene cesonia TaxID=33412 RepID=UPI0018E570FF|nr:collagenase-like [Zerene cesonia]